MPRKRGPCVVCEEATVEKRGGVSVEGQRGRTSSLRLLLNTTNECKDGHVPRARTDFNACKMLLCTAKAC